MRFRSTCSSLCVLLATVFSLTPISSRAETRCAGNIVSLRPRIVGGALLVIPVWINQSGPFDFMVCPSSRLSRSCVVGGAAGALMPRASSRRCRAFCSWQTDQVWCQEIDSVGP
jgi:hypothetical protein